MLCDTIVGIHIYSIRMEINQYDITMATHNDITMDNAIAGMPIVKSQWLMMLLVISIVMSQ